MPMLRKPDGDAEKLPNMGKPKETSDCAEGIKDFEVIDI
jgi:hypothetical protein